jgi:hypothetical protein
MVFLASDGLELGGESSDELVMGDGKARSPVNISECCCCMEGIG